ncbi:hypothetical protein ACU81Q_13340 [Komagataeibacter melomenusus]
MAHYIEKIRHDAQRQGLPALAADHFHQRVVGQAGKFRHGVGCNRIDKGFRRAVGVDDIAPQHAGADRAALFNQGHASIKEVG